MPPITFHIAGQVTADVIPFIQEDEQAHFVATFNRALRVSSGDNVASCDVHLGERTKDKHYTDADGTRHTHAGGWLEHIIVVRYKAQRAGDTQRQLTIGAIQREPGKASEFHS